MLASTVREAAERFGDARALVSPDGTPMSYAQLDQLSDEIAAGLLARRIGRGDVVALDIPACAEYVAAYAAAAKIGATTAAVNPRLTVDERAALLRLADPALVLSTREEAHDLRRAGAPPPAADDPDRPVAIVFTSGTTGRPKAAIFSGRQLRAITRLDVGDAWGGGGPMIAATSLAHVGFMTKLPWYLRLGGATLLMTRWRASDALELIARERITSVGGVPTQLALMLRDPAFGSTDVSSVQSIVLGGGPAPSALVREARDRFGAPVSVRYSSTETGGCGTGTTAEDPVDGSAGVGRPRGDIVVTIIDENDNVLPAGQTGQVCVKSPSVMAGYYRDPEATAAAFAADGSVRTGDLGWLDLEGRLHLAGRIKEMYVRGGYNVFPAEVEAVLADHPAIDSVAVIPRTDELMGERGVAVVVPRPGVDAPGIEELRRFASRRLAGYKLPDEVQVVDALPLTAMDKVDRRALTSTVNGVRRGSTS